MTPAVYRPKAVTGDGGHRARGVPSAVAGAHIEAARASTAVLGVELDRVVMLRVGLGAMADRAAVGAANRVSLDVSQGALVFL